MTQLHQVLSLIEGLELFRTRVETFLSTSFHEALSLARIFLKLGGFDSP